MMSGLVDTVTWQEYHRFENVKVGRHQNILMVRRRIILFPLGMNLCFLFRSRIRGSAYNGGVIREIFGRDITGFRSAISADRLARAKRDAMECFPRKSFNVAGKHLPSQRNKYCQCKRFIRELSLVSHALFFRPEDRVIRDNIFSIKRRYF